MNKNIFAVLTISFLLFTQNVYALSCVRLDDKAMNNGEVIFLGTVISIHTDAVQDNEYVNFKIEKIWKGSVNDATSIYGIRFWTGSYYVNSTMPQETMLQDNIFYKINHSYLVFARTNPNTNRLTSLITCGSTREITDRVNDPLIVTLNSESSPLVIVPEVSQVPPVYQTPPTYQNPQIPQTYQIPTTYQAPDYSQVPSTYQTPQTTQVYQAPDYSQVPSTYQTPQTTQVYQAPDYSQVPSVLPYSPSVFNRNLTIGSRGSDVVILQDFLEANQFLKMPYGVSKGYFGSLTKDALAGYQLSMNISPSVGFFGPLTRAAILGQ